MISYKSAGVDQERKDKFIDSILHAMKKTYDSSVMDRKWGYAALYKVKPLLDGFKDPILVSCADGVGTKIKLAVKANKHKGIGIDLVAMNVNDLITIGARPLFFLDYIAMSRVNKKTLKQVVAGIIDGCKQAGCALVGGETAEMPGIYQPDEYDLAGFCVGIVEKSQILDKKNVRAGDVLVGLASNGLHSNGFSLVRKVLERHKLPLDELLRPTRIYVKTILKLLGKTVSIHSLAHITGGGMIENIPRVIPENIGCVIHEGSWKVPEIFTRIQKAGKISKSEMYRTFNMGIGMVLIVDKDAQSQIVKKLKKMGEKAYVIGEVVKGIHNVSIV